MNPLKSLFKLILSIGEPNHRELSRPAQQTPNTARRVSEPVQQSAKPALDPKPESSPIIDREQVQRRLENSESIESCLRLYRNTPHDSEEEALVVSKILKLATTFDDWLMVAKCDDPDTKLGTRALERLKALARSFDDWKQLLEYAEGDASLSGLVTECTAAMERTASSAENWLELYWKYAQGSPEELRVMDKLCELAKNNDEAEKILEQLSDEDPLRSRIVRERLESLSAIEDLAEAYDDASSESDEEKRAFERLQELEESFGAWIKFYKDRDNNDKITELALTKALQKATSPAEFIQAAETASSIDDDDVQKIVDHVETLEWPEEKWDALYADSEEGSGLEKVARIKLVSFWKKLTDGLSEYTDYMHTQEDNMEDPDDDIVGAYINKIFSLATLQELQIIAALAPEDSPLREKARERVEEIKGSSQN